MSEELKLRRVSNARAMSVNTTAMPAAMPRADQSSSVNGMICARHPSGEIQLNTVAETAS